MDNFNVEVEKIVRHFSVKNRDCAAPFALAASISGSQNECPDIEGEETLSK